VWQRATEPGRSSWGGLDNIIVIATLDGFHVLDVAHGSTPEIPSATVSSRDT
jgi:hypothetical protein